MLDGKAYCEEVWRAVARPFTRRGYSCSRGQLTLDNPNQIVLSASISRESRLVGRFRIHYRCVHRRKQTKDGPRETHHPLKYHLYLELRGEMVAETESEVKVVANKTSCFERGVPGCPAQPMFDDKGHRKRGRPKVRKWAAWAAKRLAVYETEVNVEAVHES